MEDRHNQLNVDIDMRMRELWLDALEVSEWSPAVLGPFLRRAYGQGYCDALREDTPGKLCLDNGYAVPERGSSTSDAQPTLPD